MKKATRVHHFLKKAKDKNMKYLFVAVFSLKLFGNESKPSSSWLSSSLL